MTFAASKIVVHRARNNPGPSLGPASRLAVSVNYRYRQKTLFEKRADHKQMRRLSINNISYHSDG